MTHYRLDIKQLEVPITLPFTVSYIFDSLEPYQLEVEDPLFVSISEFSKNSTSITISFEFNANMPGRLKVSEETNPANTFYTVGELSSNYGGPGNGHKQTVGGLSPSTSYVFVSQTLVNDVWIDVSVPTIFTTSASVVAPGNGGTWPIADRDLSLPFQGAMFGSRIHGSFTSHTASSRSGNNAMKYTFSRSGNVTKIGMHKRHNTVKGYSRGTGGDWDTEIWTVGPDGLPGTKLGGSDPSVPHLYGVGPVNGSNILWVSMETPIPVVAGQTYWIVREVKDRSVGLAVWNGHNMGEYLQTVNNIDVSGPWPRTPHGIRLLYRNNKAEDWQPEYKNIWPITPILFEDGFYEGNYWSYEAGSVLSGVGQDSATRYIGGNIRARERITQHGAGVIDGVWVFFGHHDVNPISGAPLRIDVKNSGGSLLAYAEIPASQDLSALTRSTEENWIVGARTWGYAPLNTPVTLTNGQSWIAEFSCAGTADYQLTAPYCWINSDPNTGVVNRDLQLDAILELSTNGGSSWAQNFHPAKYNHLRELPFIFTTQGNPRYF